MKNLSKISQRLGSPKTKKDLQRGFVDFDSMGPFGATFGPSILIMACAFSLIGGALVMSTPSNNNLDKKNEKTTIEDKQDKQDNKKATRVEDSLLFNNMFWDREDSRKQDNKNTQEKTPKKSIGERVEEKTKKQEESKKKSLQSKTNNFI